MKLSRIAQVAVAVLIMTIGASFITGAADSNAVPPSSAGEQTHTPVVDDFKPAACAALSLTSLVTGSGVISGTGGNDLILGSNAADTITSNAGDDCVLAGGGNDGIFAGTGGGAGGGSDVLDAGSGSDTCHGEAGMPTYISCETVVVSGLGSWVSGLVHATPAGQGRALVFVGMAENNPARTLSGVTYGGQPLTWVASATSGSTPVTVEVWVLNEAGIAAATDSTFVPTWTGAVANENESSFFLGDVNQSSLAGATSTSVGLNGSPLTAGALANTAGDMVIFAAGTGNAITMSPNNGFIEGTDTNVGTTTLETGYQEATGVNLTPSTTPGGNAGRWTVVGAVFKSVTTP